MQYQKFMTDRRGSVSIMFGVTIFALLLMAGVALDFARTLTVRGKVQAALDATVVYATSLSSAGLHQTKIKKRAKVFYEANLLQLNSAKPPIVLTFSDDDISATAAGHVDTSLTRLSGIKKLDYSVRTQALIPKRVTLEAVLVLDYSASMDSAGKYPTMRDAAIKLVDDLSEAGESNYVKFGLVPFSKLVHVNLPASYIADADPAITVSPGCVRERPYPYNITQDLPDVSVDATKWRPVEQIDTTVDNPAVPTVDDCVQYSSRDLTVRPLSDDFRAIKNQLTNMTPYGWTNISFGLSMGWHLLSPSAPFTEGASYADPLTKKAIVLLSDGKQTVPGSGASGEETVAAAEQNLETLCSKIKDADVIVVTVAFDLDDDTTRDRLANCATSSEYFFEADSNSDLKTVFTEITEKLAVEIRLTL